MSGLTFPTATRLDVESENDSLNGPERLFKTEGIQPSGSRQSEGQKIVGPNRLLTGHLGNEWLWSPKTTP